MLKGHPMSGCTSFALILLNFPLSLQKHKCSYILPRKIRWMNHTGNKQRGEIKGRHSMNFTCKQIIVLYNRIRNLVKKKKNIWILPISIRWLGFHFGLFLWSFILNSCRGFMAEKTNTRPFHVRPYKSTFTQNIIHTTHLMKIQRPDFYKKILNKIIFTSVSIIPDLVLDSDCWFWNKECRTRLTVTTPATVCELSYHLHFSWQVWSLCTLFGICILFHTSTYTQFFLKGGMF